jgi:hypothetical protein
MPGDVKRTIQRFRRLFDMGLHGPDIFYYYSPMVKSGASFLGIKFHEQTGRDFFQRVCRAVRLERSEAAIAYLYGVLCHYCLDAYLHPFVTQNVSETLSHQQIEAEFDRFLLETDGKVPPCAQDLSPHLKLTPGEWETVAKFYPGVTGGKVSHSISLMALCIRLLAHPDRKLQELVLNCTAPQFLDHRLPEKASDTLAPYISELSGLYHQALEVYPVLLEEITVHLQTGRAFSEAFAPDFG